LIHELNTEEEIINTEKGFDIIRRKKGYYILVSPPNFKEIGVIDLETETCLNTISWLACIRLKGHIISAEQMPSGDDPVKRVAHRKANTMTQNKMLNITVTVYGPREDMAIVGKNFSQHRKYLQEPYLCDASYIYSNPHEFTQNTTDDKSAISYISQVAQIRGVVQNDSLISDILDGITPRTGLEQDDAGHVISTELLRYVRANYLKF